MGKVTVNIEIINHADEILAANDFLESAKIRKIVVSDVLIDIGATTLCLPNKTINQLGLKVIRKVVVNTITGDYITNIYQDAKINILGRSGVVECIEVSDDRTPLLGVIPMEQLGLEVDVVNHRLNLLPDFDKGTYLLALNLT